MIRSVSLTRGVRRGRRKRSATPARAHDSISQRNCATPAADNAQASACPSRQPNRTISNSAAIRNRFNRIGVAAGAANRSIAFNSPPCSAVSEMNSR